MYCIVQVMCKLSTSWHVKSLKPERREYCKVQVKMGLNPNILKNSNKNPNYFQKFFKKYSFWVIEYESKQQSGHSVYYAKFGQRTWVRKNVTLASLAQVALYMCKYFQVISKYDLCEVQTWQMMYTMVQAKTVKYLIIKFYPYFIKWFVPKKDL